ITGSTGTGKTQLLLNHALDSRGGDCTVFIACEDAPGDLIGGIPGLLGVDGTLADLLGSEALSGGGRLVVMFDAYNEAGFASGKHLRQTVRRAAEVAAAHRDKVRFVFGVRSEFLRDVAPELFEKGESDAGSELPLESVYSTVGEGEDKSSRRRVIELDLWSGGEGVLNGEQEAIYEAYRSQGFITLAQGGRRGCRPLTAYRELAEETRSFLDRPLLVRHFAMRYHDSHAAPHASAYELYDDIILHDVQKIFDGESRRVTATGLLSYLALHLICQRSRRATSHTLMKEAWFSAEVFSSIVSGTSFVHRTVQPTQVDHIDFSSDWVLEYFLARYIVQEVRSAEFVHGGADPMALEGILAKCAPEMNEHLVGGLTQAAQRLTNSPALLGVFMAFASGETHEGVRASFVRHLVRTQRRASEESRESFAKSLCTCRGQLGERAWARVLAAIDSFNDQHCSAAMFLLDYPGLWENLGGDILLERRSVRAHQLFRTGARERVLGAREDLSSIDLTGPGSAARERVAFVLGRCHQWLEDYEQATATYSMAARGQGFYASMCRHQLGFLAFFAESDFSKAATLLEENVGSPQSGSPNHSSLLLYATCAIEVGDYERAGGILKKELERRRGRGELHGQTRALRALSSLHLQKFETDSAVRCCEQALALMHSSNLQALRAEAMTAAARVRGLLTGESSAAQELLGCAEELARASGHQPTVAWVMHNAALHTVVHGTGDDAKLEALERLKANPNLQRHLAFVRRLGSFLHGRTVTEDEPEFMTLQRLYAQSRQAWYEGVLKLMLLISKREPVPATAVNTACFRGQIDPRGLEASFLYKRLVSAGGA
ncbi:MAG TPA: tetratricopeptide repeat protein, partial [Phycisphaerales bacterium]|nr:tetratricopeptide repeat protein [Phycisphaerales bacterium]